MPKAWSSKDERQYEHIKDSAKKKGRSTKRAKEIAARTVNKQRSEEGRTKEQQGTAARKTRSSSTKSRATGRRSGGPTVAELRKQASKLNIAGRSKMNKAQLSAAVKRRQR